MTEGKLQRLHARRCQCASAETEEVEGLPNCLRCTTCKGWFALRIGSMSDLDKLATEFPPDE